MKLLRLKLHSKFRGLEPGFELNFRQHNDDLADINEPICLVGLNGSGKSNTLEAICEIFYYLEVKTITVDKDLKTLENRYLGLGFEIEYFISNFKWKEILSKIEGVAPFPDTAEVIVHFIKLKGKALQVLLKHPETTFTPYPLEKVEMWSLALPTKVIGYSSGQNELISNPFIKLDYHYFDEFIKSASSKDVAISTDVNRMFFMDYESNELVVLANYLFQEADMISMSEAKKLNKKLRVKHLHSFSLMIQFKDYRGNYVQFASQLNLGIENLKKCATAFYDNLPELEKDIEIEFEIEKGKQAKSKRGRILADDEILERLRSKHFKNRIVEMDFYADSAVRKAFRHVFKHPYELFRLFYLLRLMNIHTQSIATRNLLKSAPQGTNLSDLIPRPVADSLLFNIDGIKLRKENSNESISYKQLSDGEHQLLHVIGTLNLMRENDTLFILDEPETHFNPEWRAKMIQLIMACSKDANVQQDHFITSHSPFIISDCKPTNVYIFNKHNDKVKVTTAHERRLNTFGTSVNILTDEVFNKNESQGDYSLAVLNEIKKRRLGSLKAIQQAKEDARILGESVEKTLLFRKLLIAEEELKAKLRKNKNKNSAVKAVTKRNPTKKKRAVKKSTKSAKKKRK